MVARLVMTITLSFFLYFFFLILFSSSCLVSSIAASNSVMYRYKDFSSPRSNQNQNLPPNPSLTCQIHVLPAVQAPAQLPVLAVPFSISQRECPSWDCRRLEVRLLGLDFGLVRRATMSPSFCLRTDAGVVWALIDCLWYLVEMERKTHNLGFFLKKMVHLYI